jgi:hypothetical protein
MRTTLTLDDDVAAKLKAEIRRSGNTFKQLVNNLLRRALNAPRPKVSKSFRVRARKMGLVPGLNYDNIAELIEYGEGPFYK